MTWIGNSQFSDRFPSPVDGHDQISIEGAYKALEISPRSHVLIAIRYLYEKEFRFVVKKIEWYKLNALDEECYTLLGEDGTVDRGRFGWVMLEIKEKR